MHVKLFLGTPKAKNSNILKDTRIGNLSVHIIIKKPCASSMCVYFMAFQAVSQSNCVIIMQPLDLPLRGVFMAFLSC